MAQSRSFWFQSKRWLGVMYNGNVHAVARMIDIVNKPSYCRPPLKPESKPPYGFGKCQLCQQDKYIIVESNKADLEISMCFECIHATALQLAANKDWFDQVDHQGQSHKIEGLNTKN